MINEVLRDYLNKFVIAYINDILIYSPDYTSHVKQVCLVLEKLLQNQLYVKGEKCEFHTKQTSFLGYHISEQGVSMDDRKVNAVLQWPRPQTMKELQKFLGFVNFYRRFICNYSTVAAPLTLLTKGGKRKLAWNDNAESTFKKLKETFPTAPILRHPDPESQFIVEVDASDTGVGAVLSQRTGQTQRLHPVAYFSKKLSSGREKLRCGKSGAPCSKVGS